MSRITGIQYYESWRSMAVAVDYRLQLSSTHFSEEDSRQSSKSKGGGTAPLVKAAQRIFGDFYLVLIAVEVTLLLQHCPRLTLVRSPACSLSLLPP